MDLLKIIVEYFHDFYEKQTDKKKVTLFYFYLMYYVGRRNFIRIIQRGYT